ncbi:Ctr copper transporter [Chaetomium sp. MPI-SDFR-AT-0129]|nr:Ctr copper transporter [Chaetomium sp. MPI-SDFR-AT-0129]
MMSIVFSQSTTTPLLFASWQPRNTSEYAATCVALIILATATRALSTIRPLPDQAYRKQLQSRFSDDESYPTAGQGQQDWEQEACLRDEASPSYRDSTKSIIHFPFLLSLGLAAWETAVVGLGYLLMLAIMTMNLGYFIAVLMGTFLGGMFTGNRSSGGIRWEHC